jgi:hypothetical protein
MTNSTVLSSTKSSPWLTFMYWQSFLCVSEVVMDFHFCRESHRIVWQEELRNSMHFSTPWFPLTLKQGFYQPIQWICCGHCYYNLLDCITCWHESHFVSQYFCRKCITQQSGSSFWLIKATVSRWFWNTFHASCFLVVYWIFLHNSCQIPLVQNP